VPEVGGPFQHIPGVVVASKIHGDLSSVREVTQMVCLFTRAYNKRTLYDIVVFHTLPIPDKEREVLIRVAAPANITLVQDAMSLQEQVDAMDVNERQYLLDRCRVNATAGENITWHHTCCEEGYNICSDLSYAWQSEFRSYFLWRQTILRPYRTMLWMDSDAFATRPWEQDPIQIFIKNGLVLLFDSFPKGAIVKAPGRSLERKIRAAYGKPLCVVKLVGGTLESQIPQNTSDDCGWIHIDLVHGFLHITDLNFYRSKVNLEWSRILVSPHRFLRQWDDQVAVTVPPAVLAPHRAWDMRANGINLSVSHNWREDGKKKLFPRGFVKYFRANAEASFPDAFEKCYDVVTEAG